MAKKCSECGKQTKDKYRHCPHCGNELSESIKSEREERINKILSHKAIWISLFSILVLVTLFFIGNFWMVPYYVTISEKVGSPYIIEEPYSELENYPCQKTVTELQNRETTKEIIVDEAYTYYEDLNYYISNISFNNHFWTTETDVSVYVQNRDEKTSNFSVKFNVITSSGTYTAQTNPYPLKSGEGITFERTFTGYYRNAAVDVITSKKEVIGTHKVTKSIPTTEQIPVQRSIADTCTREVQKSRNITKYSVREEYKTETKIQSLFWGLGVCDISSFLCLGH